MPHSPKSLSEFDRSDAMTEENTILFPVLFNPLKHHRNYILDLLKNASPETIIAQLDSICNNYIDIYTGTITPAAISNSVISILKSNQALDENAFNHWVATKNGYRQITLEDRSEWIVRKSNETKLYIHLHPARTGPFTMRFKGSTLKTVYLLKTISPEIPSLEKVNSIRKQIGLSPVKKLERSKGILNCYEKFFKY
jgi:hypothetical protein